MHKDIERIKSSYDYFYQEELINKIEKDIINLMYMPRIHKTLISSKDKNGEYRRIVREGGRQRDSRKCGLG